MEFQLAHPSESGQGTDQPSLAVNREDLDALERLKFFLATAPSTFDPSPVDPTDPYALEQACFNRFLLPTGDAISCVKYNGLYHVTGTDVIRILTYRMKAFGRIIMQGKKWEEGVFSDLRNLKQGTDSTLELPKSPFLELLFKYNCIRTQKKQKVFYWYSVPHDRLFIDALERDAKREKLGQIPTTRAIAEPALSFVYDARTPLYDQFLRQSDAQTAMLLHTGIVSLPVSRPHEGTGQVMRLPKRGDVASLPHFSPAPFGRPTLMPLQTPVCTPFNAVSYSDSGFSTPQNEQYASPGVHLGTPSPLTELAPSTGMTSLAMSSHASPAETDGSGASYSAAPIVNANGTRWICPLYTCGTLFEDLTLLVNHISEHSAQANQPVHAAQQPESLFTMHTPPRTEVQRSSSIEASEGQRLVDALSGLQTRSTPIRIDTAVPHFSRSAPCSAPPAQATSSAPTFSLSVPTSGGLTDLIRRSSYSHPIPRGRTAEPSGLSPPQPQQAWLANKRFRSATPTISRRVSGLPEKRHSLAVPQYFAAAGTMSPEAAPNGEQDTFGASQMAHVPEQQPQPMLTASPSQTYNPISAPASNTFGFPATPPMHSLPLEHRNTPIGVQPRATQHLEPSRGIFESPQAYASRDTPFESQPLGRQDSPFDAQVHNVNESRHEIPIRQSVSPVPEQGSDGDLFDTPAHQTALPAPEPFGQTYATPSPWLENGRDDAGFATLSNKRPWTSISTGEDGLSTSPRILEFPSASSVHPMFQSSSE